jgi:hypothetical protein
MFRLFRLCCRKCQLISLFCIFCIFCIFKLFVIWMEVRHMFSPINHFFVFSFQRSGQDQGRCVCLGKDQAFYTSGVRTWQTHPVKWTLGLLEEWKSCHGQQPVQSVVFQKCVFQCAVYSLRWTRAASWSTLAGHLLMSCFVTPSAQPSISVWND